MNNYKTTATISADFMYLVFLGNDEIMGKIVDKLNDFTPPNPKKITVKKNIYVTHDMATPCIDILETEQIQSILRTEAIKNIKKPNVTDSDIDDHKKYVIIDEGVETAQCLVCANVSHKEVGETTKTVNFTAEYTMLMIMIDELTHYKLSFPAIQLGEEENADEIVSRWLKDNNIEDIVRELTIRPVNIVGTEHDILVFVAFVDE